MYINTFTELTSEQKRSILDLWNREYPEQIRYATLTEFDTYLDNLKEKKHYLLAGNNGEVQGWGFQFMRDMEQWFAIIVDSKVQRRGYGTLFLDEMKKNNTVLNGWVADHNNYRKQDGSVYISPLHFYIKNGFSVKHDIRIETEKLSAVKIVWHKNAHSS
ncbi:MAG: hypothetical protein K0Q79_203 [Flavipsychrobacter sp.]|jgi:GNAT superfamily N-acetyltransferase|nr:hypothetical protein [Flavipsychrobacter sp.]